MTGEKYAVGIVFRRGKRIGKKIKKSGHQRVKAEIFEYKIYLSDAFEDLSEELISRKIN